MRSRSSRRHAPRFAHGAGVLALLTWAGVCAARSWSPSGLSWHYFAAGGHALVDGSGFGVYAELPTLQVGPLAVLAAAAFEVLGDSRGLRVAQVSMMAAAPLLFLAILPLAEGRRRWVRVVLSGLLLMPAWAVLAVRWAHLDDVLAMSGGVLAVAAVGRHRNRVAGFALAAAISAKPWALGFAPLLLAGGGPGWWRVAAAVTGGVATWLPFVAAEPRTLDALRPAVPLISGSGLHTLGVRGRYVPDWGRTVQLIGLTVGGLIAALRGRWPGVLLVALAVRIALDPQDNPYYVGSAVLAAVVYDVAGRTGVVPWASVATSVALWQPFTDDYEHRLDQARGLAHWWFAHPGQVGWIHLAWAVGMVALVLCGPRREPPSQSSSSASTSST